MFLRWQNIPANASRITRIGSRLPLVADGRWRPRHETKTLSAAGRHVLAGDWAGVRGGRDEMNWDPGRLFSSVNASNSSNSSDRHDGIRGARSRMGDWVWRRTVCNKQPGPRRVQESAAAAHNLQAPNTVGCSAAVALGRTGLDAPRSSCDGASARRGSAGGEGMGSGWLTASNGLRHASATAPQVGQLSFCCGFPWGSSHAARPHSRGRQRAQWRICLLVLGLANQRFSGLWGTWDPENLGRIAGSLEARAHLGRHTGRACWIQFMPSEQQHP